MDTLNPQWLQDEMQRFQVPGISLGLLRGGRRKETFYLGYADRERGREVTGKTLYEAASLTKPLFAYYVLGLERRGLLSMETKLAERLPEYPICKDLGADRITVLHTLSHSAGLENWGEKPPRLLGGPGEKFRYSGEGYRYLQACVESLCQDTLDHLFARQVFPVLGMYASALRYQDASCENVAMCYDVQGRAQRDRYQVRELDREPNAAYSLYTNLEDYCHFLEALWEDKALLEKMASPQTAVSDPAGKLYWGAGAGVWLGREKMLWHYGDNGNFKSLFYLGVDTGDGLVYFSNSYHGLETGFAIAEKVFGEGYGELVDFAARWE